jgi:hypothetical protein
MDVLVLLRASERSDDRRARSAAHEEFIGFWQTASTCLRP